MNSFTDPDAFYFSRSPKHDDNKYGLTDNQFNQHDNLNKSSRKINIPNTSSSSYKENINHPCKSSRNIKFTLETEINNNIPNDHGSNFGKSCVAYGKLGYNPNIIEKDPQIKSRWELTEFPQNSNKNLITAKTEEISNLIESKYAANNRKFQKDYKPFNSTMDSQWKQKSSYNYNIDSSLYVKTRESEESKKYEKLENNKEFWSSKSSKNIGFFDDEKSRVKGSGVNEVKNNDEKYMSSTFSFNPSSTVTEVNKTTRLMGESMGGLQHRKIFENYISRKNLDLESEPKQTLARVQKKISICSLEPKEPCLDDFFIGDCKGEGRFGKVYLAIHKKSGFLCALKKIKKESVKYMVDQFIQEVKIQMFLNHPKLVKMYGYFADSENFYMLVEYMEEGSLYSLMKKNKKFEEPQAIEKIKEICEGIKEMHDNSIVHRDLKPENVVISHGVCKVCDFGWSAICEDRRQTYCGTLDYVCPEIAEGNTYDSGVDIWCIGILAYELMCGKAPFYDISKQKTIEKIKSCKIESFPNHLSQKAVKFIDMIIQKDPTGRVGIEELLNSDFLKSGKN